MHREQDADILETSLRSAQRSNSGDRRLTRTTSRGRVAAATKRCCTGRAETRTARSIAAGIARPDAPNDSARRHHAPLNLPDGQVVGRSSAGPETLSRHDHDMPRETERNRPSIGQTRNGYHGAGDENGPDPPHSIPTRQSDPYPVRKIRPSEDRRAHIPKASIAPRSLNSTMLARAHLPHRKWRITPARNGAQRVRPPAGASRTSRIYASQPARDALFFRAAAKYGNRRATDSTRIARAAVSRHVGQSSSRPSSRQTGRNRPKETAADQQRYRAGTHVKGGQARALARPCHAHTRIAKIIEDNRLQRRRRDELVDLGVIPPVGSGFNDREP